MRNALIAAALLLAACDNGASSDIEPADTLTSVAAPDTTPLPPAATIHPVIRPDGIGHARIGMRIADLRRALPAELALGDVGEYMVDIIAVPVLQGADTLYSVLFPADAEITDNAFVERLVTTHPDFRTSQGVGPGMTLEAAAAVYGQPTLSYNTEDESREYARFPALSSSITIRVSPGSDIYAGFYETSESYNETTRYDPDAKVWMVFVGRY